MGTIQPNHFNNGIFPNPNAQIDQSDFKPIPNYSYTQHIDPYYSSNYTVLSHRQRPILQLERYELFFNTYQQYLIYQEVYNWRNRSRYLVQARAIKQKPGNRLCGTFHEATLLLQRIPIRACEITDIPLQQGLYMLYTSIIGFRKIYQRTGYFDVSLDMICINKDALVKVWLNSNLSKIYPQLYSINQNLTETDFIYKILTLCQPLIDFDGIQQKFSEFLKLCYFSTDITPRNQQNNSNNFCSYSKITKQLLPSSQQQIVSNRKLQQQNVVVVQQPHSVTFDKIIQYFERYLGKHNLVIAREMKSIRDVFRIQQKIYSYNDDYRPLSTKLKSSKQTTSNNYYNKQNIQQLQFINNQHYNNDGDSIMYQNNTSRKNSKWINYYKKKTDRTIDGGMTTHKSEQFMRKMQYCKKELEIGMKRPPSVSFGYLPAVRNNCRQVVSPQHIATNFHQQRQYLQGRQRIRTTVGPSVSFTICNNQSKHIKTSIYSPNKSDMPQEGYFYKNKTKSELVASALGMSLNDDIHKNDILLIESRVDGQGMRRKTMGENKKGQLWRQSQLPQKGSRDRRRTIWYTVEEERYLDEDIANDIDLLEKLKDSE